MSRGIIEIPIEVWEGCERDAERIAFLHKQVSSLAADNQRLRKAGDAMHRAIKVSDYALDWAIEVWLAAKEGRDVK